MDILTALKRNVPGDVYDKVFQYTMMHLFKECDVLRAMIEAYRYPDTKYSKRLDNFVVFQDGPLMKFGNDYSHTSNKVEWGFEDDIDFERFMEQGLLKFKYLRIAKAGEHSSTYLDLSDFISYAYDRFESYNDRFVEKSHEVTIEWDQLLSADELLDLAQAYPDKSFVVFLVKQSFESKYKLVEHIDVIMKCPNIKLKVRYFFHISSTEMRYWENNFRDYISLFQHPHPRIEVFTCVLVDLRQLHQHDLSSWLVKHIHELGYDKINHFVVHGDISNDFASPDMHFVQKMTNLKKLSLKGNLIVNKDTLGDLSGLHKLRHLKITSDGYSDEWLSTCLPDGIERIILFKNVKSSPQYYPIKLGAQLKCLILKSNNDSGVCILNTRDFVFTNPQCDVFIEDIVHDCQERADADFEERFHRGSNTRIINDDDSDGFDSDILSDW